MSPAEGPGRPRSQLKKILLTFGLVGAFVAAMLQLNVGHDAPSENPPVAAGVDVSSFGGPSAADLAAALSSFGTPSSSNGLPSASELAAALDSTGTPTSSSGAPSASDLAAALDAAGTPSSSNGAPSASDLAAALASTGAPTVSGLPSSSSSAPSSSTGSSSTGSSTGATGAAAPGPAPGAQPGALDVASPILSVKFGKNTLALVLKNGFVFTVTCNEACDVTAVLDMARQLARRLGIAQARTVVVGRRKTSLTRAGTKRVAIKLTKKAKRRLRRSRRRGFKLRLRVDTKDKSGNKARTFGRNLTLKR